MSNKWLNNLSDRAILLVLLAIALMTSGVSLIFNLANKGIHSQWWEGWFQNFSTEMFGAFLGFWLLGMIVDRRRQQEARQEAQDELKKRLIREMRSKDNATALNAVEEMQAHGWLEDGSLQGAFLVGADLHGAFLAGADLSGADLSSANLKGASLAVANLQEAGLEYTNLHRTNLGYANLCGADLGFANLHGADLSFASLRGANLEHATLPDEALWTPDTDMERFTNTDHPNFWCSADPKSPAYRGEGEPSVEG